MQFKLELGVKIITGEKTQTRRWTPHMPVGAGKTFYAQLNRFDINSRFAQLQAVSVFQWDAIGMTKAEAKAEGFESPDAFRKAYFEINKHKTSLTPSGKKRLNWAIEFRVVNLLYNPTLPDVIKAALREQWKYCGCGDSFFPINTNTSEKRCNTCKMLDRMQIDNDFQSIKTLAGKQDFGDADSKAVVELRDRIISKIHENYDVEIKPFQIITSEFVDELFATKVGV